MPGKTVRHIISLSGGKDSTALAIYMRERLPSVDYVFSDTDKELPETYEYLDKLEAYLGQSIVRLRSEHGFDHWLQQFGGYLPSARMRWCTRQLKIKPFLKYLDEKYGDDEIRMYIGIRADEDRGGFRSTRPNITPVYPFIEDDLELEDIERILDESGIGFPGYYSWRSRSGCYFCFYQQRAEWLGLKENHPELFELAKGYEKDGSGTPSGEDYTWSERESLAELEQPERAAEILARLRVAAERSGSKNAEKSPTRKLLHILGQDDDPRSDPCSFCHI